MRKVYNARIGKRETYCGHDHKTMKAAKACARKTIGYSDQQFKITSTYK